MSRPGSRRGALRRRINVRQLELLAALEHAPSLSAAAHEVHLSPPAASRLLNAASASLGVELFERAGRSLRATAAGRALIQTASRLIGDLDRAETDLAAIRDGRIGLTTLGAGVGACYALVPLALSMLLEEAPGIAVALREGSVEELLALLSDGRLDLAVGRIEPVQVSASFEVTRLYEPAVSIVAGPNHPLARRRRLSWSVLLEEKWILPQAGTPMRAWLEQAFRRAGGWPDGSTVESSSISANVMLLGKRNLVWPVSSDIAEGFVEAGMLRALRIGDLKSSGALVAVRSLARSLSPAAQRLLRCIRAAASTLDA